MCRPILADLISAKCLETWSGLVRLRCPCQFGSAPRRFPVRAPAGCRYRLIQQTSDCGTQVLPHTMEAGQRSSAITLKGICGDWN
jgi:hypothetical protein